ncbi:hypothetical protein [Mucilaginibacter sp. 22184]|uniref:hypothetical protein n=1 Tax=Mucilaginibacter sp. 22184 TaxID=3453887 RepID=UPI003F8408B9
MSAPFRLRRAPALRNSDEAFKDYLSRLLKLIPSEIIGLYMVVSGFIPSDQKIGILIWSIACFFLLIGSRYFGTKDEKAEEPAQPVPIVLALVAFVVWVYWLGGPFEVYHIHVKWVGSALVAVVSFVSPWFFKGYN